MRVHGLPCLMSGEKRHLTPVPGIPEPSPGERPENMGWCSQNSHLSREVVMGHFHSQERLVGGRPGEAVLKQEAMLLRNEEGQNQHVRLGEREDIVLFLVWRCASLFYK